MLTAKMVQWQAGGWYQLTVYYSVKLSFYSTQYLISTQNKHYTRSQLSKILYYKALLDTELLQSSQNNSLLNRECANQA